MCDSTFIVKIEKNNNGKHSNNNIINFCNKTFKFKIEQ